MDIVIANIVLVNVKQIMVVSLQDHIVVLLQQDAVEYQNHVGINKKIKVILDFFLLSKNFYLLH